MTDKQPEFPSVRKGYAPKDVDAYIAKLGDELSGLRDDLVKAQDELAVTQEELTASQGELTTTQGELAELRDTIDDLTKAAKEEAIEIVEAAKRDAIEVTDKALADAEEIRSEIRQDEEDMKERLRTRENEITAELDEIDTKVGQRKALISDLEKRLEAEEGRYGERVNTLRTVAAGLEDALRAVVDGSLLELGVFLETQKAAVVDNDIVGAAVHHHFTTDALLAASPMADEKTPKPTAPGPKSGGASKSRSPEASSMTETQGQSILAAMGALRPDLKDVEEND